jgi:hypothetical protein
MLTRKNPKTARAGQGKGKKPKKHFVEAESIEDNGDGKDDDKMEEIVEDTTEVEVVAAVEEAAESVDILCIQADGKLIMVEDPKDIPVKVAMLMAEGGTKKIEMVTFKSMSEYDNAKGGVTTPGITVNEVPPIVTPIKEITKPCNGVGNDLPVLRTRRGVENPYVASKKRAVNGSDEEETAEMGLFAKKMKDTIKSAGIQAVIHLVATEPEFWSVRVALLDFINPKRQFTHWLHRPMKWQDVINMFADDEEGMKRVNMFLSYMTSVRFRDPAGNDIPETITTRGRNGTLTLYRDVFLVVLPKHLNDNEIPGYILESFGPIFNDTEIQSCYHMQYMAGSENDAANQMLSPIRSNAPGMNGKYWSMLEGALTDNYEIIKHESLNKILTSNGIVAALEIAGNTKVTEAAVKGKSIPEGLKAFVYGNNVL